MGGLFPSFVLFLWIVILCISIIIKAFKIKGIPKNLEELKKKKIVLFYCVSSININKQI